MIVQVGEDPEPRRPAKHSGALREGAAISDQRLPPGSEQLLNGAMFSVRYDEMVVVKDIELFSLCEHHLLPFFGKCHVAYFQTKRYWG